MLAEELYGFITELNDEAKTLFDKENREGAMTFEVDVVNESTVIKCTAIESLGGFQQEFVYCIKPDFVVHVHPKDLVMSVNAIIMGNRQRAMTQSAKELIQQIEEYVLKQDPEFKSLPGKPFRVAVLIVELLARLKGVNDVFEQFTEFDFQYLSELIKAAIETEFPM